MATLSVLVNPELGVDEPVPEGSKKFRSYFSRDQVVRRDACPFSEANRDTLGAGRRARETHQTRG